MNRKVIKSLFFVSFSLFWTAAVLSASSKPLQVKVVQVNDRRSSGSFSSLTISFELPDIPSSDVAASRVLVKAAGDNTGRSLIDDAGAKEPGLESNRRGSFGGNKKPDPISVSVELKNPDRKATRIREIRGDIELFMPGKDPNSIATIPRFVSYEGKTLSNKALKANGVEISIVSKAQLDAERNRIGEKRREEAKKDGFEGDDLESAVKNAMESFFTPDEGDVVLKVADPNHRIQDIAFVDKAGEVKPGGQHDVDGFRIVARYGEKPTADWSLRVSLQTPKNIVRYPFSLSDVPLP